MLKIVTIITTFKLMCHILNTKELTPSKADIRFLLHQPNAFPFRCSLISYLLHHLQELRSAREKDPHPSRADVVSAKITYPSKNGGDGDRWR